MSTWWRNDFISDVVADCIAIAITSHLKDLGVLDLERDFHLIGEAREAFLIWTPDQTSEEKVHGMIEMVRDLQGRGVLKPGEAIPIIERARSNLELLAARVDEARKANEILDRILVEVTDKLDQLYAKWPRN